MRVAPFLERDLTPHVAAHLEGSGYRVWAEVPFNGRIADLVAVKEDEVVGVELKLRDFRQAHRQALAYQVGCHRTFVGLPLDSAFDCLRRHRHAFHTSGAGLFAVNMPDGDVRELLPARPHAGRLLPFLADALRDIEARPSRKV